MGKATNDPFVARSPLCGVPLPLLEDDIANKSYVDAGGTPPLSVMKTVDQSITASTVLQDDDELFFQAKAFKTYFIRLFLFVDSSTIADFKEVFDIPLFATGDQNAINKSYVNAGQETVDITTEVLPGTNAPSNPQTIVTLARVVMGLLPGTVQFRWAQRVVDGTTTVQKGSYMDVKESL